MPRISWSDSGTHYYETGIDRGVLYPNGDPGVAWPGLTSVIVDPSGGEPRSYYLDGIKYLNIPAAEEFEATLNAFIYPNEFAQCEGVARVHSGLFATQQPRKPFGLTYRTRVGSELNADFGYKIHIVYNALAAPSQRTFKTIGSSTDVADFSWKLTTKPPVMSGIKQTAHLEIDTRFAAPGAISEVEDILYGTDAFAPRLPSLADLVEVFDAYAILTVTDNGDGTFTVTGPDDAITMLDPDTFQIDWPSVVYIDAETYTISSL